jgi:hypothetical protein
MEIGGCLVRVLLFVGVIVLYFITRDETLTLYAIAGAIVIGWFVGRK